MSSRNGWKTALVVIFSVMSILLVVEALCSVAVIAYYRTQKASSDFIMARLWLSSYFYVSPVETHTKARFVGYRHLPQAARLTSRADPLLGWKPAPNIGVIDSFDNGNGVQWYFTNKQGFASAGEYDFDYARKKPEGTFRVIVVGGSIVFGTGAATPIENLPSRIAANLRAAVERTGRKLEVINAGVAGYYSAQELLYIQTDLQFYQPDLIVVVDGPNDYQTTNRALGYGARDEFERFRQIYDPVSDRLNQTYTWGGSLRHVGEHVQAMIVTVTERSGAIYLVRRLLEKFIGNSDVQSLLTPDHPHDPLAAEIYGSNLLRMADLVRSAQIPTAFFLHPMLGPDGKTPVGAEADWVRHNGPELAAREDFYAAARAIFARLKAERTVVGRLCVSDLSRVPASSAERLYEDSSHMVAAGTELLSKTIITNLGDCGMLPSSQDKR